jgi:geranylgeranyl pyrophosphate synthase
MGTLCEHSFQAAPNRTIVSLMSSFDDSDAFEAAALSLSARAMAARPMPYLDGLNPAQRAAVEALEGPVLMLAGAGTGKTRALTARIVHLLMTGTARPNEILAVTFTNKAAREMKLRVASLLGQPVEGMPWLGTFHAICVKLLRRHAELAGLKSNFTILDTDDQQRLMKQLIIADGIDEKRWPARQLAGIIDGWKNRELTPEKLPAGSTLTMDGVTEHPVRAHAVADDAHTPDHAPAHVVPSATRRRQQRLAEITELIHVASLLHDDVIDGSATRRGLRALNLEVGNKLAILAGDFLLARASVTLASLRDVEVIELLSRVLEHLVAGEVMQMTAAKDDLVNFDHYVKKTYLKTASLIANSSKAVAILGGHVEEGGVSSKSVKDLAYEYGKHLGLAFQYRDDVLDFTGNSSLLGKPTLGDLKEGVATAPVLFAAEEFPGLLTLIGRRFKCAGDVERAASWVARSDGVEKTRRLAGEHAAFAVAAIDALPPVAAGDASRDATLKCRRALKELARLAVERAK